MPRFDSRLGCSTISFRHQPLPEALATIAGLGFCEIDLGALPGVCDHVPYVLDMSAVEDVARTVIASGLQVRSINGDIGDLNVPLADEPRAGRQGHLDMLVALAVATDARALVLPCGAADHTPVETLEADVTRVADELASAADVAASRGVRAVDRIAAPTSAVLEPRACAAAHRSAARTDVGIVMDFSHVVASGGDPVEFVDRFGSRIEHVHIRDAEPGNINLSVGRGTVDFRERTQGTGRRRIRRPLLARTRDSRRHPRPTARCQPPRPDT